MQPVDVQQIGEELAIKWNDRQETYLPLEALRRSCPCAECQGERDVLGNLHKPPERPLSASAFQLVDLVRVGAYGLQLHWGDGHATGIYTFEYMRRLAQATAGG